MKNGLDKAAFFNENFKILPGGKFIPIINYSSSKPVSNVHLEILSYNQLTYFSNNIDIINNDRIIKQAQKIWINDKKLETIPSYCVHLINVTELFADQNRIQKIPKGIIKLHNLRLLCFYDNMLKTLPIELCYLSKLCILDLGCNLIVKIPSDISNLKNLRALYLNDNQIDEIPEEVFELRNLRVFEIQKNFIDVLPSSIIILDKLEYLDISENYIEKLLPEVEEHLNTIHRVIKDKSLAKRYVYNSGQQDNPGQTSTINVNPVDPVNPVVPTYTETLVKRYKGGTASVPIHTKTYERRTIELDEFNEFNELFEAANSPITKHISNDLPDILISGYDPNDLTNYINDEYEEIDFKSHRSSDDDLFNEDNIASKNVIEFNYDFYKQSIIKFMAKFINDNKNPKMIQVKYVFEHNKMLSNTTKHRITTAFEQLVLPDDFRIEDEPIIEMFLQDPTSLFNFIIRVIEELSTKDTLYDIINTRIMQITSWNIKEVYELASLICGYVDDYNLNKLLESFQMADFFL